MGQSIFNAAKNLYNHGLITKDKLRMYVQKGLLTPEEYEIITGEVYEG